jgi:hypothetical protein
MVVILNTGTPTNRALSWHVLPHGMTKNQSRSQAKW